MMTKEKAKIKWQCHRGMLELDLLLIPFVENHYDLLDDGEKIAFSELLTYPDPIIFAWLMGHEGVTERKLINIVQLVQSKYCL